MQQKQLSDEIILKTAKEIAVKFIEIGRVTPANFDSVFRSIYHTIEETTKKWEEDHGKS